MSSDLAAMQRRVVAARLHAGVVRFEAAPRCELERDTRASGISTGGSSSSAAKGARARGHRLRPQPRVQELRAGIRFARARPLQAMLGLEARVRSCRRTLRAPPRAPRSTRSRRVGSPQSWPSRFAICAMIHMSSRASPGGSSALRTRCTRRSLFVTVPSASHQLDAAGKHHVRHLRRAREEDVLRDEHDRAPRGSPARDAGRPRTAPGSRRSRRGAFSFRSCIACEHLRQVHPDLRLDRDAPHACRSACAPRGRGCPGNPAGGWGSLPCRRRPARCSARAAG